MKLSTVKYLRELAFFMPIFITLFLMWKLIVIIMPIAFIDQIVLKNKRSWTGRLAYSIDQTFNVLWSPWYNKTLNPQNALFGHPDETVSSVIGKNLDQGEHWTTINKILTKVLDGGVGNHGLKSIEKDEGYKK